MSMADRGQLRAGENRTVRRLIFIAGLAAFAVFTCVFWDYSIDDAFVTFRYAENLADGHGLVFNPGAEAVEGYSNFLWLLLLSLLYTFGLPTYATAKIIGLVSFLLTAAIWYRHFERDDNGLSWLTAPLFLLCPITAFWGLSGLELGLHALLVTATVVTRVRRSPWFYVLLPLIVLSRPEGFLVGCVLIVTAAALDRANGLSAGRQLALGATVLIAAMVALTLLRLAVFGRPLPNTFYVKTHETTLAGFLELGRMLAVFLPLSATMVWGAVRIFHARLRNREMTLFIALFVLQAVVSSLVSPVMNFQFRYLVPFLPFMIAVSLHGVSGLKRPSARRLAAGALALSLMAPLTSVTSVVQFERNIYAAQKTFIEWSQTLPDSTTVSLTDIGRIPYYTKFHYYDIWGLVNKETGREGFSAMREFLRLPDYFVLVGYVDSGRMELRFGRERLIAYRNIFDLTYEPIRLCLPRGADPEERGYYYFVCRRKPEAGEIISRPRSDQ